MKRTPMTHAVVVLVLTMLARAASAELLAIGAVDAQDELRSLAQAVRFLMETERDTEAPGYIAARTAVEPTQADYVLTGTLQLDGVFAVFKGTVTSAKEPPVDFSVRSLRGEASKLARSAAAAISQATGKQLVLPAGDYSLAEVQPYAAARAQFDAGNYDVAGRSLLGASKITARTIPAAKRVVESTLSDERVPATTRLSLAAALERFDHVDAALSKLKGKQRREWSEVIEGRREIVRFQVKQSMERVGKLRGSKLPEVALAKALAAQKTHDQDALAAALDAMTKGGKVHPQSAAFVAELSTSEIPDSIKPRLGTMVKQLSGDHPALASKLALKAAAAGQVEQLGSIDPYMLSEEDAAEASSLVAGGTISDDAATALMIDLAVADGRVDDARKAVTSGLAISPGNEALLAKQVELAQVAPDAETAGPEARPEAVQGDSPAKQAVQPAKQSPPPGATTKAVDAERAIATELVNALTAFVALPQYQKLVLAPISPGGNSVFAVRWLDHRLFASGLAHALARTYGIKIAHDFSDGDGLKASRLGTLLARHDARAAMLWEIKSSDRRVAVKLVLYRQGSSELDVYETTISGTVTKLVSFNPWLLRVGGALAVVAIVFIGFRMTRKTGAAWIRIKAENDAREEYLTVRISNSPTPPALVDLSSYVETLKSQGVRKTSNSASHVGRNVEFNSVPVGKHWVHLYGVYVERGEYVPMKETRELVVTPGEQTIVVFDLVPKEVEYALQILDGNGPIERAKVWLDDDKSSVEISDKEGRVTLWTSIGDHVLHILDTKGEVKKEVTSPNTRRQEMILNLDVERRLAELGKGIDLEEEKDDLAEYRAPAVGSQPGRPKQASKRVAVKGSAPGGAPGTREEVTLGIDFRAEDLTAPPSQPTAPREREKTGLAAAAGFTPSSPGAGPAGGVAATAVLKGAPSVAGGNGRAPASSGTTGLSRYRAEKELGAGAMGVVMLAKDQVLDRTVALKVMGRAVQEHPAAAKMFKQEAKALAALNHPNIVTVFDQGDDNGQMFIVMEFVEGATLEDKLEDGPMTQIEALAITAQLGDALAYAHARNVIHRDIKPANIFLDSRNRVKLGDFGLARVMKEAMIRQTEIKGTPLYMSPEQIMGKDIDGRSDIYAVGCTMYEMLTGRPPFIEGEILFHQMHTEPEPPSKHNADIPPQIDSLVLRCIAKEKDARPADADALVAELRELLP